MSQKYELFVFMTPLETINFETAFSIISQIYPSNTSDWQRHGYRYHFEKIYEETSELKEAYERYFTAHLASRSDFLIPLRDEIADIFVWTISAWGLASSKQTMTKSMAEIYQSGCPWCGVTNCQCEPVIIDKTSFIGKKSITIAQNFIDYLIRIDACKILHRRSIISSHSDLVNLYQLLRDANTANLDEVFRRVEDILFQSISLEDFHLLHRKEIYTYYVEFLNVYRNTTLGRNPIIQVISRGEA